MGGSKSSGSTKVEPWGPSIPYLMAGMEKLPGILNKNLKYYPGSTVGPVSEGTKAFWNSSDPNYANSMEVLNNLLSRPVDSETFNRLTQIGNQTASGKNSDQIALRNLTNRQLDLSGLEQTANGDFLNANPYLDAVFNKQASQVEERFKGITDPGLSSKAIASGTVGSGSAALGRSLAAQDVGKTLNNLSTDVYSRNYEQERQNQLNAQNLIAGFRQAETGRNADIFNSLINSRNAGAGLINSGIAGNNAQTNQNIANQSNFINQMSDLYGKNLAQLQQQGLSKDAWQQAVRTDDVNRFNFYQNEPLTRLQNYFGVIPSGIGSSTSSKQPGGGIGGALTGGLSAGLGAYALGMTNPLAMAGMVGVGALGGML